MKATWRDTLVSLASFNEEELEVVIDEFESFLVADEEWNNWDKEYFNA